jgi:hypothetical protein
VQTVIITLEKPVASIFRTGHQIAGHHNQEDNNLHIKLEDLASVTMKSTDVSEKQTASTLKDDQNAKQETKNCSAYQIILLASYFLYSSGKCQYSVHQRTPKRPNSKPHRPTRQQAIAKTPAQ